MFQKGVFSGFYLFEAEESKKMKETLQMENFFKAGIPHL